MRRTEPVSDVGVRPSEARPRDTLAPASARSGLPLSARSIPPPRGRRHRGSCARAGGPRGAGAGWRERPARAAPGAGHRCLAGRTQDAGSPSDGAPPGPRPGNGRRSRLLACRAERARPSAVRGASCASISLRRGDPRSRAAGRGSRAARRRPCAAGRCPRAAGRARRASHRRGTSRPRRRAGLGIARCLAGGASGASPRCRAPPRPGAPRP